MNERRNAHAAGKAWSKWEGPRMYEEQVNWWLTAVIIWLSCMNFGFFFGALVARLAGAA